MNSYKHEFEKQLEQSYTIEQLEQRLEMGIVCCDYQPPTPAYPEGRACCRVD